LHHHYILYKPDGYISQLAENAGHKKKLLGELYDFPDGTMAIGRLDEASEGLLLLTTDGKMSEAIRSKKVEKEYYAQVDGEITFEAVEQLQNGVEIGIEGEKYTTLPCHAFRLSAIPDFPKRNKKIRDDRHGPTSWVSITVCEGKFRQVRKMTATVGFPTLRLVRVRIGNMRLKNMDAGEVRKIEAFDY
jgi:23S rRNA pseudouridine2457 synthase